MKKLCTALLGLAAGLGLGYWGWQNRAWLTASDLTTGESAEYPTLRSRIYYASVEEVRAAAEHAIPVLPGGQVRETENDDHTVEAEVDGTLGPVAVTVYCQPLGHGQTRAVIRAHTGRWRGFGGPITTIRALQTAMDVRLTREAAI